jgi:transaldolase/glucose-6-phosphate isomerase
MVARQKKGDGLMSSSRSHDLTLHLPPVLARAVDDTAREWDSGGKVGRLWARDATLWTGQDEASWMGWLDAPHAAAAGRPGLEAFAARVREQGLTDVLLLGMGGSSLCPEVFALTFGAIPGSPRLHVLDSTDPAQVARLERQLPLDRTLFIVASKSGTTLEPTIFKAYFEQRVAERVGRERTAARFVAITDPGSKLAREAASEGLLKTFDGVPEIGGRFSALSNFGLVPAALMGLDVGRLLDRAASMADACGAGRAAAENPGVHLGLALGLAARSGRNKITFVVSPAVAALGAWLEQLLAESTGKQGVALIPVDGEALGPPGAYADDRVFAYLRLASAPDAAQDAGIEQLERAGQPVVRMALQDAYDLGAEFFRWEIATAVAGAILRINPFDQPDVEASKVASRRLTDEYERRGALPDETPVLEEGGLRLFTDDANARALRAGTNAGSVAEIVRAHFGRVGSGDYVALLAYLDRNEAHVGTFQAMRQHLRERTHAATCVGFGPRFLHSTGQAYKGGPNAGVFLQVTGDASADLPVPGRRYTFGVVEAAQARGDFGVLTERGRRALRVHLGGDIEQGLAALENIIFGM